MKKQIALLAAVLAVSGFTALGQGYVTLSTGTGQFWNEYTTPGVGIRDNTGLDVAFLWAPSGTSDLLASQGTSQYQSSTGGAVANQVATNGVASISAAGSLSNIVTMITTGGWAFATNDTTGSAGFNTLISGGDTSKGAYTYANGLAGGLVQILGASGAENIELIAVAWNASAASLTAAGDIGWSNPISYLTGASSTDPNGGVSLTAMNQFGTAVIAVPEPTTLALAGLGGLSMLFLRRRKS
jgi:hypothetical protein